MSEETWNTKKISPEENKLIECRGNDWSDFICKGMFVPYKGKPIKGKTSRFCIYDPKLNTFSSDRETWKDVTEWRYVEVIGE